ncbi:MAG: hypothetical protein ACI4TI_03125 [Christensenellales bacterium]
MKKVTSLKKNFVINTNFVKDAEFNEPVYVLDSGKDYITAFSTKKNKVIEQKVEITDELNTKTFIKVKDFFKKCTRDDCEYRIEKVNNGDVYLRVAYLGDISLFLRINEKENKLIMTNIKKYKFYPSKLSCIEALNKLEFLNDFDRMKIKGYISNIKNLKRDYLYTLNQTLDNLKRQYQTEKSSQSKQKKITNPSKKQASKKIINHKKISKKKTTILAKNKQENNQS